MFILFIKNILFTILIGIFLNPIFSQESENNPFQELDPPTRQMEPIKSPPKKVVSKKSGKIILNPLTYRPADEYQLKGIFIGKNDKTSFAVVSTDDIQDQVITLGDKLGKEGFIVFHIEKDKIVVGYNSLKTDKDSKSIYLVD